MNSAAKLGLIPPLALAIAIAGCQKKSITAVHWPSTPSAVGEITPAALVVRDTTAQAIRVGEETVVIKRSEMAGAFVRDSWIKNVKDMQGRLVYADGRIYQAVPASVLKHASSLTSRPEVAAAVLKRLKQELPSLAEARWVHGPALEFSLREHIPGWRLLWVVDYLDRDSESFKRLHVNLKGVVVSSKKVSADYINAPASVYPKGPKSSALEEVLLQGLLEEDGLASPRTRISCSDEPALIGWEKAERSFRFSPQDRRFDAVQAYYYVDRAQSWFREHAGIELSAPLTVDVFAGGTQSPRNTACYYFNIVRLGVGDGKTYHNLMRDPSVVMHEVSHAMIEAVSHLPTQDEGGSINEGFADFFAADIIDSPRMGEVSYVPGPYKRNIDNLAVLKEKNGGLYHDSLIVSGTLWEIRKVLGSPKGLTFSLKVLARLNTDSNFAGFGSACQYALQEGFTAEETRTIAEILQKRGWMERS